MTNSQRVFDVIAGVMAMQAKAGRPAVGVTARELSSTLHLSIEAVSIALQILRKGGQRITPHRNPAHHRGPFWSLLPGAVRPIGRGKRSADAIAEANRARDRAARQAKKQDAEDKREAERLAGVSAARCIAFGDTAYPFPPCYLAQLDLARRVKRAARKASRKSSCP